jgi:hypothetical protein
MVTINQIIKFIESNEQYWRNKFKEYEDKVGTGEKEEVLYYHYKIKAEELSSLKYQILAKRYLFEEES